MTKKESLREEYKRLRQELAEMNENLNERQKEVRSPEDLTSDFSALPTLIDHKIKRIKEIERQLKESANC